MKLLEEIKVSVYENVYSKRPEVMSFLEVITMCIHPIYAATINTIRRYHTEGDNEAAQKLKSQLPCFTPAGTFNGAHAIRNFLLPSNIICLDYDHVPDRQGLIKLCADDPHTVAVIESPTDGIKIFSYVEGIEGRHREGQQLVSRYYDHLLQLQSDPACKDESRLCYFSYSPNGYLAGLYQPFILEPAVGQARPASILPIENKTPDTAYEFLQNLPQGEIEKFLSSYIFLYPLTKGQRHTHLFKMACEACRRHYPEETLLRELTTYSELTDFPIGELKSAFHSGYERVINQQPEAKPTASRPVQNDKLTKMPYGTPASNEEADDSYWQGEELRKNTVVFPDELFENLPALMDDCIIEDEDIRERDISFLSIITALSSVLPQTFGIYNHKKYSTHIFSIIISPAGSGKSIAQVGRYLLEEIHSHILTTSEQQQKKYKQERSAWQAEYNRKQKTGDTRPEEPTAPPFKLLIIPATTSYTRMQIQMQDNGEQGSIIFDTEAQTLSTANHLDCGNFDDMLRKAFEHENIDSSYKANGLVPIYIRYPKLALLLTGTPGQLNGLLSSSENGLASRILYYTFRGFPHWKEMGDDCVSLEDRFKPLSHQVFELYNFCLKNPVLFHLSRSQWKLLNETFSRLLEEVTLEGNDDLQAVVKRYAFLVMRISMIQTRIRQFEANDLSPEIYCNDIDFKRSLRLVLCCYEHSRLLLSSMGSPSLQPLKNPDNTRNFYKELPDTFTTDEAMRVGAKYDINIRKVARLLKALNGVKINKVSHGVYEKIK